MKNNVFKILALIMFLVVFPLVSYLYLKRGVQFRRDVINELKNKTPLNQKLITKDSAVIDFQRKCTLVELGMNSYNAKHVFSQFKDAKGFQFLSGDSRHEENTAYKMLDSMSLSILNQHYKGKYFLLIDSLANVRNSYMDEPEQLKRMVIHITALLPYYNEKKGR
jgi:hypothetical protein